MQRVVARRHGSAQAYALAAQGVQFEPHRLDTEKMSSGAKRSTQITVAPSLKAVSANRLGSGRVASI